MAWKVRTHLVPAMTGQSDSAPAPSMALAARSPGATNASYGTPPTLPVLWSTAMLGKNWLFVPMSSLTRTGAVHVLPASSEKRTKMSALSLPGPT